MPGGEAGFGANPSLEAAAPWFGPPLPAHPWVLPPGSMVLSAPPAAQPSPAAAPVTAGGVTYYPPAPPAAQPSLAAAVPVTAGGVTYYPQPAGAVGLETPGLPGGYYGGVMPGAWGTPHTPVPFVYGEAGGAAPMPLGPHLPYWGLPHPATGAGIYPQPYPALLPYGAPGHTPYHHLPPEYLPVQPSWGLAGGQGVPPNPTPQEAPLADPLGTPPRSTLTTLGSGGERQNLSGSATADPAAGSYSAGQSLSSYGGTSPAFSPSDQPPADQPRARRLLGKKKVSFEADAGGTGLGEPVPPAATGEALAAPPAAGLSGRPEHGVDSGEPRAGVGARGDGVAGRHSRGEGPYSTASVPVEPHKELTLGQPLLETSELSTPVERLSAPARLPYRPPEYVPTADYEEVRMRKIADLLSLQGCLLRRETSWPAWWKLCRTRGKRQTGTFFSQPAWPMRMPPRPGRVTQCQNQRQRGGGRLGSTGFSTTATDPGREATTTLWLLRQHPALHLANLQLHALRPSCEENEWMQRLLEEDPEEVGRALQVGRDLPSFNCHRKDATQGARFHLFEPFSRFADGRLVDRWAGKNGELIHYRRGLFEPGEVCPCSSCLRARKRDSETLEGPLQRSWRQYAEEEKRRSPAVPAPVPPRPPPRGDVPENLEDWAEELLRQGCEDDLGSGRSGTPGVSMLDVLVAGVVERLRPHQPVPGSRTAENALPVAPADSLHPAGPPLPLPPPSSLVDSGDRTSREMVPLTPGTQRVLVIHSIEGAVLWEVLPFGDLPEGDLSPRPLAQLPREGPRDGLLDLWQLVAHKTGVTLDDYLTHARAPRAEYMVSLGDGSSPGGGHAWGYAWMVDQQVFGELVNRQRRVIPLHWVPWGSMSNLGPMQFHDADRRLIISLFQRARDGVRFPPVAWAPAAARRAYRTYTEKAPEQDLPPARREPARPGQDSLRE
ncbi:hypothetical protein CYMTET_10253 [Cymbomonas tetramitiformis]|uniref:Uncharacterized protein n=1 Tax=Cymbomonas tetramitiformis TaxID=36881 RepID=A0AAE0LEN1_9CHLO|nr:hypothetical protein CYMTET_10253 [Cymbomonas tetramitiformis]